MATVESKHYAIGVVSSATGDVVEAALVLTDGRDETRSLGSEVVCCDEALQWGLLEATQNDLPTTELLRIERELTDCYAEAVERLRTALPREAASAVVGLDGHLVRSLPAEGLLLQIGDPWRLAAKTGLPVVTDFRRYDIAAGGQGAPLEAMYHWALMANEPRPALMLNFGAVTSLTWLSRSNDIIAGDVGPGLELLDEWVQEVAEAAHDHDGSVSSQGQVNEASVCYALESPFFARPMPRTPTRADFEQIDMSGLGAADGAATLCAVIADAVVAAVDQLPERPRKAWVTGVGSNHPLICGRISEAFDSVESVQELGLDPKALRAEAFAWLAVRYIKGLPVSTPETTGCKAAFCAAFATDRGLARNAKPRRSENDVRKKD